jgi:integrase
VALNEMAIRQAKPRDRDYKLSDGHGLQLLVRPSGGKTWNLAYRFAGKQKKLTIGTYPVIGLGDARNKAHEARRLLTDGKDPAMLKKLSKNAAVEAHANTFKLVAEEWLERQRAEGAAMRTMDKHDWLLRLAYPALGNRPVAQIGAAEILVILRKVEKGGKLETARRLRSTISRVFRYAVVTVRAEADPSAVLVGATQTPTVRHHAAVLDIDEVGPLMRAIRGYKGSGNTVRWATQFQALTFVRSSELRFAVRDEFDFSNATWTIPGPRMKIKRRHIVPLSRQAIALAREIMDGSVCDLLFPSARSRARPISDAAINAGFRRMGYTHDEMTGHGFRRMASTFLNENGFPSDHIEAQLAHTDEDQVRRAYNEAQYLPARHQMMQWWADFLDAKAAEEVDLIG